MSPWGQTKFALLPPSRPGLGQSVRQYAPIADRRQVNELQVWGSG